MSRTRVLALAVVLASAAGCGGGRDKAEPPAELQPISAELKVERVWHARLGDSFENLGLGLAPASDGTRIFAAAHDGTVAAHDAASGERLWSTKLEIPLGAGPSYGDGMLVVASNDGALVALSAADGSERWRVNMRAEMLAKPIVARDMVIVRTVDGRLTGLEESSGLELWSLRVDVPTLTLRGNATPVLVGERVIAGFDDGKVIAAQLRTGEKLWEVSLAAQRGRTEIERLVDIDADLRAVGNDVYVVGYQSRAAMIAGESGQILWSTELSATQPPGVDWVRLYVTDDNSEIVALDRRTGGPGWRQNALRLRRATGPTPYGQAVVIGDLEGYLHWLSVDDGRLIARARATDAPVSGPPLVVGELLYVQTDGGTLSAFRAWDPAKENPKDDAKAARERPRRQQAPDSPDDPG